MNHSECRWEYSPYTWSSVILTRLRFILWHAECLEGRESLIPDDLMMLNEI